MPPEPDIRLHFMQLPIFLSIRNRTHYASETFRLIYEESNVSILLRLQSYQPGANVRRFYCNSINLCQREKMHWIKKGQKWSTCIAKAKTLPHREASETQTYSKTRQNPSTLAALMPPHSLEKGHLKLNYHGIRLNRFCGVPT